MFVVERKDFNDIFDVLHKRGYDVIGPSKGQSAIVLKKISSESDMPIGWGDAQVPGHYDLKRREDNALFGYANPQHSARDFFQLPNIDLVKVTSHDKDIHYRAAERTIRKLAFIGIRSCDLHAIAIQDRVFTKNKHTSFDDSYYKTQREQSLKIAINCSQVSDTCFCLSQNTGPRASIGFDLALTEVISPGRHHFCVEVGTEQGNEILSELKTRKATSKEIDEVDALLEKSARGMKRSVNNDGIKELFYANYEHPRWEEVAKRCYACTNCTLVCPTCFCNTIEDSSTLDAKNSTRTRRWDSCYTIDFSYIHGGSVRTSHKARYRHWAAHKLATWWDQFDTTGCVGCGRCITWCPAGIDITEEAAAIRGGKNDNK